MSLKKFTEQIFSLEKEISHLYRDQERLLQKEAQVSDHLEKESIRNTTNLDDRQRNNFLFKFDKSKKELQSIKKGLSTTMNRLAERNKVLGLLRLEYEKMDDMVKQNQLESLNHQKELTKELEAQKKLRIDIKDIKDKKDEPLYDFFICHSSEDKVDLVKPLAEQLIKLGAKIWYDEFEMQIGDSLRQSIDKGLRASKYGIIVLSKSFFERTWTQYELNGFVNKEMNGTKVILPIWHRVTKDEVQNFSLSLADKVALNSSVNNVIEIADKLYKLL